LHIYSLPPIDLFQGALTMTEAALQGECWGPKGVARQAEALIDQLLPALDGFREAGWEGDYSEGPFFFAVPRVEVEMAWGVIVKQNNNGTTFVASPYPFPWLEQFAAGVLRSARGEGEG
tara:strand:- start:518 stop:874 length:357 start_codon:yes stop_codon:yes gene_type:complete